MHSSLFRQGCLRCLTSREAQHGDVLKNYTSSRLRQISLTRAFHGGFELHRTWRWNTFKSINWSLKETFSGRRRFQEEYVLRKKTFKETITGREHSKILVISSSLLENVAMLENVSKRWPIPQYQIVSISGQIEWVDLLLQQSHCLLAFQTVSVWD